MGSWIIPEVLTMVTALVVDMVTHMVTGTGTRYGPHRHDQACPIGQLHSFASFEAPEQGLRVRDPLHIAEGARWGQGRG